MIKNTILLITFLLVSFQSIASDSIKLEINADKTALVNDHIRLYYVVNAKCKNIKLSEDIIDFEVIGGPYTSQTATSQLVNGVQKIRNESRFSYILEPRKEGVLYIPGASVIIDGKTYSCDGMEINVLPKKKSVPKKESTTDTIPSVFLKQMISSKKVSELEPVKVSYKLYFTDNIYQIHDAKFPAFDGFWVNEEKIDSIVPAPEIYDSIKYHTAIIREYTIYPLSAGNLIIDKFSLDLKYQKKTGKTIQTIFGDQPVYDAVRDTFYTHIDTVRVGVLPNNSIREIKWDNDSLFNIKKINSKRVLKEKSNIVLAIDISGSMLTKDFKPNRMEVSKNIIKSFKDRLPKEKTGLVLFAGECYPQTGNIKRLPSKPDYKKLVPDSIFEDGTAIGMGLISSMNLLDLSQDSPKAIILLTDGTNNVGNISPLTAADIARQKGINIFAIGMGGIGVAPFPVLSSSGETDYIDLDIQMDEETLKKITSMTGGKYFRATDNKSFMNAVDEIIRLLPEAKQPDTKRYEFIAPENIQLVMEALKDI